MPKISVPPPAPRSRAVVGVDVFIKTTIAPAALGEHLKAIVKASAFRLKIIESRGAQVYPPNKSETDVLDHYRCRFVIDRQGRSAADGDVLALLGAIGACYSWMHVEKLQGFYGAPGFTLAAGEP